MSSLATHATRPGGWIVPRSVFGLRDRAGAVLTEVGVPSADPGSDFTILADSLDDTQTGIALANPSSDRPLHIMVELRQADGSTIASTEIDLEARGHQAVFLSQLFEDVEGIQEFLGSIRLRASFDFSAMTLRSTGDLLTSLPTVAPPPENSDRTRLALPHVADGVRDTLSITTALALFNNTEAPSRVTLDFFRSDGVPMTVQINDITASSFDFELQFGWSNHSWREFVYHGFSLYGGLFGLLAAWLLYHRFRPFPLGKFLNCATPALALGLALGRIGCFLGGCDGGRLCTLAWGVRFPPDSDAFAFQVSRGMIAPAAKLSLPAHPTQLYEMIFAVVVLIVAWFWLRFVSVAGGAGEWRPRLGQSPAPLKTRAGLKVW